MNYEEKYKQALGWMQSLYKGLHGITKEEAEHYFPELKESEDERIKREILEYINSYANLKDEKIPTEWLEWLEKQDKQYIPAKEIILNVWELGEMWKEITKGMSNTEHGTQLDYILKHWNEGEHYTEWLEKQGEPEDKGEISDGYHTFNELYRYRMLYNAAFFNLLPKELVHKSKRHHDGEECFGGGWFIVMANLPTGQISNHYELKDWDLFQIPEKEIADEWDGHTPQEAAERLQKYLLEKQNEQPTDKVESKFKVGDWVIDNFGNIYQIETATEIESEHIFGYTIVGGGYFNDNSNVRLWTINDANDGDVLVDEDNNIGLYNREKDDLCWHSCIYLGCDGRLRGFNIGGYHNNKNTKPATKEQRDLLFAEMKEAGYEWRQEEKKLIKMKETKFKVGDWITTTDEEGNVTTEKIIEFLGDKVRLIDTNGFYTLWPKHELNYYHLWTIQDAKDGDVLSLISGQSIFLFDGYDKEYCHYSKLTNSFSPNFNYIGFIQHQFVPATKEQHDLLFQKMKEAGYEWDTEKKELKKIEHKMLDADEVIEWVKTKVYDDSTYGMAMIDQFKKDFGL